MHSIDGTRIKEYFTCPRLPFQAFHHDRSEELEDTPRSLIYFSTGRRVEAEILATIPHEAVDFPKGDFDTGFRETLAAMERRVPVIANAVFKLGEFVGRPDLLLFDANTGGYEVADIKSTMHTKTSARMQVAFYSRMLAQFAIAPVRGHVILRDGSRDSFELADIASSLAHVIERVQAMRRGRDADPGACWQEHCLDCRFRALCAEDLAAVDAVAQLPGITRAQVASLSSAGIKTLRELADPTVAVAAAARLELQAEQLRVLAARAVAVLEDRPVRLRATHADLAAASFGLTAIHSDRLVEPHVAIAGTVFADPSRQRMRWLRVADAPDAASSLRDFLSNVSRSTGPIVVFGGAVKQALDSALAHHTIDFDLRSVSDRFFDLKAELRRTFAMPGFDRNAVAVARAFGLLAESGAADEAALAALAFVEGEPDADPTAVESVLRAELLALSALRTHLLGRNES